MASARGLWQFPRALPEQILAFSLFTLAGAITPGPNNTISTVSGATFGFRRTWLHPALRYVGAAFLLYLAWKLARANAPEEKGAAEPVGFMEAALFQWLNPKAWSIALGAIAAFTTPGLTGFPFVSEVAIFTIVSAVITLPSLMLWCLFGVAIAQVLKDDRKRRIFNLTLAALLAVSVIFLFV
jgi:threonine/homoserine/homoserine lactone efflux protein